MKIDRTTQDVAWLVLPKEFKKEVKKIYNHNPGAKPMPEDTSRGKAILRDIFGHDNLTSDAEGEEEMLYVSRKEIQQLVAANDKLIKKHPGRDSIEAIQAKTVSTILNRLFGSKCLPDEEPKPAEPKFTKEDMVHCKSFGYEGDYKVLEYLGGPRKCYDCIDRDGDHYRFYESDLEPYAEPEEVAKMKPIESKVSIYLATKEEEDEFRQLLHKNGFRWNTGKSLIDNSVWSFDKEESKIHNIYPNKIVTYSGDITPNILSFYKFKKQYFEENVNLSQETTNCDKHFDNILKDSFAKERRLNIATTIIGYIIKSGYYSLSEKYQEDNINEMVNVSLQITDAIMAECEKGGDNENN